MTDTVFIRELVVDAIVGVLPHERTTPQPIVISLEMDTDTRTAATSKELDDTVDYASIAQGVRSLVISLEALLVETLAEEIAELILSNAKISQVSVSVNKPDALMDAAGVGVRIIRRRD